MSSTDDAKSSTHQKESPEQSPETPGSQSTSPEDAEDIQRKLRESYVELEEQYGEVRTKLRKANDEAVKFVRRHPGWCLVGAAGFGYLVGRLASKRWLE